MQRKIESAFSFSPVISDKVVANLLAHIVQVALE